MLRSHHVNEVPTTTCLRCHYVHAVLTTPLLHVRSYCVLIRPRPHCAFFEQAQSSTTSFTSMKTILRSMLLLRPISSYCVQPFFQRRNKNATEREGISSGSSLFIKIFASIYPYPKLKWLMRTGMTVIKLC